MTGIGTWGGLAQAGIATFLGAPVLQSVEENELRTRNIKAAVFGIPFDGGTLGRSGSSYGPRAIRDISCNYGHYHRDYDVNYFKKLNLHDCGDSFIAVGDVKATIENGASVASEILKAGAIPVILGGEHTVTAAGTMGIDKALKGKYGFISFDTHLDCAPDIDGNKWQHGSHVARTLEFKAFAGENMVLMGMRGTVNARASYRFAEENGITVFTMRQIFDIGLKSVVDQAFDIVTRGTDGFYLSIDMDALEASQTPGTDNPTPFGPTTREMITTVLPKFGLSNKLRGLDVNEITPVYDPSGITATTAVAFITELLAAQATLV
ncbi:MAG TPA: agmatinase family protein [Dehalococcoidia bacterium]|nr:agmatinase family protein [Dehalococcoidia bacterium]